MTRDTRADAKRTDEAETTTAATGESLADVDHTHPYRRTTFGSIFGRGTTVAADGGDPVGDGAVEMREISHESPTGTDSNDVFERGEESASPVDAGAVTDE